MPVDLMEADMANLIRDLQSRDEGFAIATVIRTVGATAAKPGAKALISADGEILSGWIGGGCVRGAIERAVQRAFVETAPQFISIHPEDALAEQGVSAGEERDGVQFARNGCPSQGTLDIFVEPVLPQDELMIFGASPVADALKRLAPEFGWILREATPEDVKDVKGGTRRMIVVATQGKNDLACLRSALTTRAEFVGFVGSRKKYASLSQKLSDEGIDAQTLDSVQAPVGLPINAISASEIALSILAQLTQVRRAPQRNAVHHQ
ncbi:MAG: XdhC family protein [Paracoccaceae bacterium]